MSGNKIALCLASIWVAAGVHAEDMPNLKAMPLSSFVDETSLEDLANMVVTDTKVPQMRNSATQNIAVLRSKEFEQQTTYNRNIAELMLYTSGQFVNVLSRNDANWGSYSGLGPKYNTYLLDGMPIDSFADAMSLDSAAIERVEVQKGPASVLYSNYLTMDFAGNEAPLAGTTNFVLKNRIDTPLTRLSAGIGSYGTYTGRAYTQGRNNNLSFIFGASDERSDYTLYGAPNSWLQTVKSPEYDKTKVFGNLSYELGRPDHTLSLFMHHTSHDGDMGRPNRDFRHEYGTLNFTYSNQFAASWNVQFKAGERRYDREFGNDAYPASLALTTHDSTRQNIRPMDLTLSHLHGQNGLLTMGMDSQWVDYQTASRAPSGLVTRENDARARSAGYFVQEKLQWRDWVFRTGVRHNSIHHDYALLGGNVPTTDSIAWSKNLWSLGLRYSMAPGFALYANAGSSFMVPTAKQIGGTVSAPTQSGNLANPTLKPESGVGRDLGFDWQPTRALNIGVRAFLNTITSAIVDNAVSATQTISENAGSAQSAGVELDIRYAPSEKLAWFANLTPTRTKVRNSTNADHDGTAVPFAPDAVANIGLTARLPGRLTVSSYYQWVGRYYDSSSRAGRLSFGNYNVLNVRLQQQLRTGIDLVVDLNNVGNRRYDMPFGFRDPGFNAFAGLNVNF